MSLHFLYSRSSIVYSSIVAAIVAVGVYRSVHYCARRLLPSWASIFSFLAWTSLLISSKILKISQFLIESPTSGFQYSLPISFVVSFYKQTNKIIILTYLQHVGGIIIYTSLYIYIHINKITLFGLSAAIALRLKRSECPAYMEALSALSALNALNALNILNTRNTLHRL